MADDVTYTPSGHAIPAMMCGYTGTEVKFLNVNSSGSVNVVPYANPSTWATGAKTVAVAGVAEQLAANAIPAGSSLMIRAKFANAGMIYISDTKAHAEAHPSAFTLDAGETITLKITNSNLVWVDADNPGEGLFFAISGAGIW